MATIGNFNIQDLSVSVPYIAGAIAGGLIADWVIIGTCQQATKSKTMTTILGGVVGMLGVYFMMKGNFS
jgi:hypothetical protein